MRLSVLALLICLCAPGCGVNGVTTQVERPVVLVAADSVRYIETEDRTTLYALVWPFNGVTNLWVRGVSSYNCGIPVKQGVVKASIAFRGGQVEPGGVISFTSFRTSDSLAVQTAFAECGPAYADTMYGSWSATFATPCGGQVVGGAFTLVRAP